MKVIVTTITRSPRGNPMRASREIVADQVRIGRGAECELRLADPRVPLHARSLFLGRSGPQLLDANEAFSDATLTGTARTQLLKPGMSLRIGPFQLDVVAPHHGADLALTVELVQPLPGKAAVSAEDLTAAIRPRGVTRRALSWTFFLLVLAGFLCLPMLAPQGKGAPAAGRDAPTAQQLLQGAGAGARASWNPGELAAGHQAFGQNCQACHSEAFQRVQDKDCRACHQNLADHVDRQKKVAGLSDVRCASCHRDHQGAQGLAQQNTHYAMGECSACHRDIKAHLPATATGNAADFATLHPPFRVTVVTGTGAGGDAHAERLRLGDTLLQGEHRGLKFPHDVHLDPRGVKGPQGLVKTTCASCHVPDSTGTGFRPVTMKEQCQSCHELRFELAAPERQVPHGSVDEVMATMREFYSYLAVNHIVLNPPPPASAARAIPGRSAPAPLRLGGGADVERQVTAAATGIFEKTTCFTCHDIRRAVTPAGAPTWTVNPVLPATTWLPASRFSHARHDMASCDTCHAAPRSPKAEDVLMPGIETCRRCHAGRAPTPRKVTSNCGLCHGFHQVGHAPVTPRPVPAWPSARDAALLQSAILPPARLP